MCRIDVSSRRVVTVAATASELVIGAKLMTKMVLDQIYRLGRYLALVASATIVLTLVVYGAGIVALALLVLGAIDRARSIAKRKTKSSDVALVANEKDPSPAL
jgi:hypothetical protein